MRQLYTCLVFQTTHEKEKIKTTGKHRGEWVIEAASTIIIAIDAAIVLAGNNCCFFARIALFFARRFYDVSFLSPSLEGAHWPCRARRHQRGRFAFSSWCSIGHPIVTELRKTNPVRPHTALSFQLKWTICLPCGKTVWKGARERERESSQLFCLFKPLRHLMVAIRSDPGCAKKMATST